jgi:hypothetical protein
MQLDDVEPIRFSSIEAAITRFRAFAAAHSDFEPSLLCERRGGRRRWVLTVECRNGRGRPGREEGDTE